MRKFNKFFFILAALSLAAVACQTKEEPFEPGPQDDANTYGVFIPAQEASGSHTYDPSMERKVDITVARTNDSGAITVPFTTTVSDDVFEFGDIKFADGQKETTLTVKFPKAGVGTEYSFSIQLTDDGTYISKYSNGAIGLDFSVLIVTWVDFVKPGTEEPAVITFNQGWWGEVHTATLQYYEVDGVRTCVATCNEGNGIWGDAVDVPFKFTWYLNKTNDAGNQVIDVPKQYLGFDYDDWASKPEADCGNAVYFYDWFYFLTTDGGYPGGWPDWDSFLEKNPGAYARSYYDGNGGFYFNLRYYIPGLGGWTPDEFDVVAISDGFVRVDYSLSLETDYSVDGVTPIYIEAGADVASVKYAIYEGELNSAQMQAKVEAIADGSEKSTAFSDFVFDEDEAINYGALGVSPEATGDYTLVMVAFDKDKKAQNSASVGFHFVAAADVEALSVDINVFTEPTPARYTGMTEYDSFAYCIAGSGVTEAHVYITESKKFTDALAEAVKTTSSLAVDAATLAAINANGGYYDVVGGLTPGTEYVVIVWATNGDLDTFVTATFETTPSPEVWEPAGTAVWTDLFFGPWFSGDALSWEVALEASADVAGRYRLVNVYGAAFPYNEEGDWDDSQDYYCVFNAQDPEHVYMETFDTGCNWGYGNFILTSYPAYYMENGYTLDEIIEAGVPFGTLADGVITFPAGSILKAMADYNGGNYYYGNKEDEWTITLNLSAQASAPAAHISTGKNLGNAAQVKNLPARVKFERDPQALNMNVTVLDAARKARVTRETAISK